MQIFDMYRGGFRKGLARGQQGHRRQARWELLLTNPVAWLPGVDWASFMQGYYDGYQTGTLHMALMGKKYPN